jgi:hypothetical protein
MFSANCSSHVLVGATSAGGQCTRQRGRHCGSAVVLDAHCAAHCSYVALGPAGHAARSHMSAQRAAGSLREVQSLWHASRSKPGRLPQTWEHVP